MRAVDSSIPIQREFVGGLIIFVRCWRFVTEQPSTMFQFTMFVRIPLSNIILLTLILFVVCFSKDSQYLAAGARNGISVSEIELQQHIQTLSFPEGVVIVTFNSMGDKILGRSLKGTIRCFDWIANVVEFEFSCGFYLLPPLSFDSKDQHIISQRNAELTCWDAVTKEVVAVMPLFHSNDNSHIN